MKLELTVAAPSAHDRLRRPALLSNRNLRVYARRVLTLVSLRNEVRTTRRALPRAATSDPFGEAPLALETWCRQAHWRSVNMATVFGRGTGEFRRGRSLPSSGDSPDHVASCEGNLVP